MKNAFVFTFSILALGLVILGIHAAACIRPEPPAYAKARPGAVASYIPEYVTMYDQLNKQGDAGACEEMKAAGKVTFLSDGERVQIIAKRRGSYKIRPFGSTKSLYTFPDSLVEE